MTAAAPANAAKPAFVIRLIHFSPLEYCIVAAGAIVLENMRLESGHVYAGAPARKIKPITEEQKKLLDELPDRYVMYAGWYKK